jgi:uncharacterized membrane protein
MPSTTRPPIAAGIALGVGLGGFVDGILLHQILQWHHLVSSTDEAPVTTVAGLERNTLADGLFHVFAWVAVLAGVLLLARHGARRADGRAVPLRGLLGWMLVGWGAFNVVEGVVNHHVLELHHVRTDVADVTAWDLGFLAFGVLLMLAGLALVRLRGSGEVDLTTAAGADRLTAPRR